MSRVIIDACGYFRPTVKPTWCKCGWPASFHAQLVLDEAERIGVLWGWRARLLAQPDAEECE